MLRETARVVAVGGDHAWVEPERQNACGVCAVRSGCGTQLLSRAFRYRQTRLRVLNEIDARVGERVEVAIGERALLRGSMVVFLFPLLGMFGAGLLASALPFEFGYTGELRILLSAMTGLVLSLWLVKRRFRAVELDANYQPMLVKKLSETAVVSPVRFRSGENR